MYVYVINKNGSPLMPCKPAKAKHLLKAGKAKVIKRTPFTIKLLWNCEENTQEIIGGMDTGSKKVGVACITNGSVIYQSEIEIRNDVSRKMTQRSMYRRTRRGRLRYRKPRFLNRKNSTKLNRLAPSIRSKVQSHLRERNFVESILPIAKWRVETASFDIHKISNPDVVNYQDGKQKGHYNVKAYVLARDEYKCQYCKTKKNNIKLHVHHLIYRSQGGTNTPINLLTLCEKCHDKVHSNKISLKKPRRSKTKHATEMGFIKSQLKKAWDFEETFGYETKFKREQCLKLSKTHYNDAVAICCEDGEIVKSGNIVYFKKHISSGDYKQTRGKRSEIKIPTGKLFGLRKFDLIKTPKGIGFIKGKRSSGYFVIMDILGKAIHNSVNIKKKCIRISARKTTLTSLEL